LAALINNSQRVQALAQLKENLQQSRDVQGLPERVGETNSSGVAAQDGSRPEEPLQRKIGTEEATNASSAPAQLEESASRPNRTGLPDGLKRGVETLSGMSLDHVRVHFNSAQPAQLNALAYAQGSDIHVAPGQEKHLPHEAWHVVQQAQGRVQPTVQKKDGVAINHDTGLEHEADVMGEKALDTVQRQAAESIPSPMHDAASLKQPPASCREVVQGAFRVTPTDYDPVANRVVHSTFTANVFQQVLDDLAGQAGQFRAELIRPANNPANANFNFAFINANIADQPDVPTLSAAIITAICAGNAAAVGRLTPHANQLTRLLGMHAPTNAGAPDRARFRLIAGAQNVVLSRAKATPSTVPYASLAAVSQGAHTAITNRHAAITAKNNLLDDVTNYIDPNLWVPLSRANQNMNNIRSPHTNNAGWLPPAAAATGPLEAGLMAAIQARGLALQAGRAALSAIGGQLLGWHGAAGAQAWDVEENVRTAGANVRNLFYRTIFWPTINSKAQRVHLAWQRYAANSVPAIPNGAFIEFDGGGAAVRIIWDYVNDRYYISAHYNWVDGYNPHFQITGLAASY
jgi:hypothetical protein